MIEAEAPNFSVVGIGASAGGITALRELMESVPPTSELAFVVVQHLLPDHPSQLARILGSWTPMGVREAAHGVPLEAGCVYVAPPDRVLGVENGAFTTRALDDPRPAAIDRIDSLFESLAADFGPRAIGVVLSGTGSDGAAGAIRIKQAGGVVFVQDPATAAYDGMPNAVIENGSADHVMPLGALARELVACASPRYERSTAGTQWAEEVTRSLEGMIELVRTKAGLDLTGYKITPLVWRIQRRMHARRVPLFRDYEALLHDDPTELETLIRSIPIHVTQFFRDEWIWSLLERKVVPEIFEGARERTVRAWTPACSTGEEAYSLAMLFAERADTYAQPAEFQVFATDAAADIVARAGRGLFKPPVMNDVSAERRQRFFYSVDGAWRAKRALREKMVFAPQDLIADPPFTGLDLVTCRNLLIYLQPEAARRVIYLLGSSLRLGGYLFLGKSESMPGELAGFEEVAHGTHIYRKVQSVSSAFEFPKRPARMRVAQSSDGAVEAHSHQTVLEGYDLPAVLVDERFHIVRVFGDTSGIVGFRAGEPTLDLLELLPASVSKQLELLAREAQGAQRAVAATVLAETTSGLTAYCLRVTPMQTPADDGSRLLVSFLDRVAVDETDGSEDGAVDWSEALRLSHEELDASREELQALNEELRASNEQLNAANDELARSNARLKDKLDELETQSNVLSSGSVITLFLDEELRMRFFTPGLTELIPAMPQDVGRRITDLSLKFDHPAFLDRVRSVMATGVPSEARVRTFAGRWFLKRIRPFRTRADSRVNAGVAITFTDVTELKAAEDALREINDRTGKLVSLMPAGVCTCDAEGRLTLFNQRAIELWGRTPGDDDRYCGSLRMWTAEGALVPHDRSPMADAARTATSVRDLEVVIEQPSGARIVANVNIEPLYDREGKLAGAINVFYDRTVRKRAEEVMAAAARTLGANQQWLSAQNEAFKVALGDGPLESSLGLLVRSMEQSDAAARCAFHLTSAGGRPLVVGISEARARAEGLRCWSFPVELAPGRQVGTFAMYMAEPREPTERDRVLALALAQTAAVIVARHAPQTTDEASADRGT